MHILNGNRVIETNNDGFYFQTYISTTQGGENHED
jgi:hypothetical protein